MSNNKLTILFSEEDYNLLAENYNADLNIELEEARKVKKKKKKKKRKKEDGMALIVFHYIWSLSKYICSIQRKVLYLYQNKSDMTSPNLM